MATRRYAAFLRGVMPTNAKMADLKKCFEAAGFDDVKTVLGSGNVVFSAAEAAEATLERKAEAAMTKHLGRTFLTMIRPLDALRAHIEADPFDAFRLPAAAKRIVTFLRTAPAEPPPLPVELDGAQLLRLDDRALFGAYLPSPRGPVFMTLILKTFGDEVTTRTWDTIKKVVGADKPATSGDKRSKRSQPTTGRSRHGAQRAAAEPARPAAKRSPRAGKRSPHTAKRTTARSAVARRTRSATK
jgi:uncharacterized protein (DUF1697 family)